MAPKDLDDTLLAEPRSFSPFWWLLLAVAMLAVDYSTGPLIQFPITYLFPILLAAWFHGLRWALPLALAMPLARLWYAQFWDVPLQHPLTNATIRIFVFVTLAVMTSRAAEQARALKHEVDMLEAMLPICAHCKKIRNETEEWEPLERYFAARAGTRFSHGICPGCMHAHYPDYAD